MNLITIPAGPFLMGTPERELSDLARRYGGTRESYREESPQHTVPLPAFRIAQTPITNAFYGAYVEASGAPAPLSWRGPRPPADRGDHPVVDVSWDEAQAFCAWLSRETPGTTYRLPSEAEWERAARWTDGRTFPWGDEFSPQRANTRDGGPGSTTPVGAYPLGASPEGLLDLAGNVWEWTGSLDAPYPCRPDDGRETRQAPGRRILRGGCYANPHGFARSACRFRLVPHLRNAFIGFRLAASL